jgi:hypothetical protein
MRRYVPLSRRTPLRSRPTDETGRPSRETRELVQARDGGLCVVCGRGGLVHLHHRRPVGAGGSRDPEIHGAANLVCVCAGCHRRIHNRPAWAREAGLLLAAGADPQKVPVRAHGRGLVLLDNDGGSIGTEADRCPVSPVTCDRCAPVDTGLGTARPPSRPRSS